MLLCALFCLFLIVAYHMLYLNQHKILCTAQKMKFFIKDFFSKGAEILNGKRFFYVVLGT